MPVRPARVILETLELARAGRFGEVRDLFAPNLRPLVSPEALAQAWTKELEQRGPITSVGAPLSEPAPPAGTVVKVPVSCRHGGFTLVATVTDAGRLLSLQLAPPDAAKPIGPWEAPDYSDPATFEEHDVILDAEPSVPGTLSLPRGPVRAGVVLLAGSGSLDRDETIGRNKPLKDLAWGLASSEIAVVRFDKVTYTHADDLRDATEFTLSDEYLPQTVAAVRLLRDRLDPAVPVVVLGHSLGGTVAPRIAAAEPSVAGLILLAAGAQPLHWAVVRQTRYLASLRPDAQAAAQPVIDALTEQAQRVDSATLSASTPASDLPLGAPASYWFDLRDYRPGELAAALERPILILQGGRDYQVTVADDLAVWRAALAGRRDVTIRVYPSLNHLFSPGDGPSSPAEYEPAQHIDTAVIADIAGWLDGVLNPGRTRRGSATTDTAASADTPRESPPTPPGGPGR